MISDMKMSNRELERRYIEMRLTYKNIINANTDLADENKILKEEIERLNNIINELESYLEQQWLEWKDCETDVRFMANEDKCILEKLRELKGSDKE